MTNFNRGSVTIATKVAVPASDFWELLRDWGAIPEWRLPEGVSRPLDVYLKEGHSADSLPCTRVIVQSRTQDYSHEETLIYVDADARRLYYTFNGVPGGIRNYFATTFVDADGDENAIVTCSSSFDLPDTESMESVEEYLRVAYVDNIARGIEAAIKQRLSAA
jgi:hypothetical protein